MRRLLIKLVAIETALVGWLSYWIFLVYANNPSVSAGLGEQLTKFPQLAFTTVDIAVMVIIATFAITLAFKFHRGLRPGIRLERALQMLENLMKRNLVLEAQVAELRVDKVPSLRSTSTASISVPGLPAPSFAAAMTSPPGESTGVLTPAGSKKAARITPDQGLKQPYIPVPAPRMTPPSVIVGPMTQKPSPGRQAPRPIVRPTFPSKPLIKEQLSGVSEQKQVTAPIIIDKPETSTVDLKSSETTTPLVSPIEETKEKPGDKPADGYKKKSPREED